MKKKLIISAIIGAVIVFFIVLLAVKKDWRDDFFSRLKITAIKNEKLKIKPEEKKSENKNPGESEDISEPEPSPVDDNSAPKQTMCDNECEGITSATELKYCRQICGLEEIKAPTGDCSDLSGLEKDYCLKDLAVSKKDMSLCEPVSDAKIKATCQNRITEDIIDEAAPIDRI